MYLSRLRIKNYRSIKELDLKFTKGKNVIVGKNNSGKSNIIKAIDLVLGEKSPAYQKSQNITDDDFFNGNTSDPLYIYCELEKDPEEEINYAEMEKNCYGFHVYGNYSFTEPHLLNLDKGSNFYIDLENIFLINKDQTREKYYISNKYQDSFKNEFEGKDNFAYIFKAWKDEFGKIQKDIRLLYKRKKDENWVLSFSAQIRNEFIQSAIIPAFRDPYSQLRIADYTWFGKLLKHYTQRDNPDFVSACESLKTESNTMFQEIINDINTSEIDVAFPKTTISLQCSPKTIDAHKLALIYVDDGFESLLSEKGSGIQSAVIIGLFDFYTRNILHVGSSLLAIEEPELYLHPHGRRVISSRLESFLENNKNQVIMTTHAPEFITSVQNNINIIVTKKTDDNASHAFNASFENPKDIQIISKAQNSEIFFADKVILVEGAEKYILEAIAEECGKHYIKGKNWLDIDNVSIINVGGKSQFETYVSILSELEIEWSILADFDYIREGLKKFLQSISADRDLIAQVSAINSELGSIDKEIVDLELPREVFEDIQAFEEKINELGYPLKSGKLIDIVKNSKKIKKLDDVPDDYCELKRKITDFIAKLRDINIYVLTGELEHFYSQTLLDELRDNGYKKDGKKEQKVLYLTSELLDKHNIMKLIIFNEIWLPICPMLEKIYEITCPECQTKFDHETFCPNNGDKYETTCPECQTKFEANFHDLKEK